MTRMEHKKHTTEEIQQKVLVLILRHLKLLVLKGLMSGMVSVIQGSDLVHYLDIL